MNTVLLKVAMLKNNDTQLKLAEALHLPASAVSERINGKRDFRQNEMDIIKKRYNLTPEEMVAIFFAEEVS